MTSISEIMITVRQKLHVLSTIVLLANCVLSAKDRYEAPEPFEYLHDFCSDCNPTVQDSPDPLVAMTWGPHINDSQLQIYRVFHPSHIQVEVDAPGQNSEDICRVEYRRQGSKQNLPKGEISIWAKDNCTIRIDWGVERAAWLELISSHIQDDGAPFQVEAAISEFNKPYPGKTKPLQHYGSHTYRLETNPDLYEGARYTWLNINFPSTNIDTRQMEPANDLQSELIEVASSVSLVAKIKPVNYTGFFSSSNHDLTKAWYTGAYGVRLNMEQDDFNSILTERGDRVAIQGDGHPTIDASLVAFSPYKLVANVLNQTDSGNHHVVDQEIMAYPMYWVLSAIHYYMASGDQDTFDRLIPDISKILDARIQDYLNPDLDIGWFGWDDRVGNGWCFHAKRDRCPREAHLAFAGLVAMVCKDFYQSLFLANRRFLAQKYLGLYHHLGQKLVHVSEWPSKLGVHAAANAINSGFASSSDIETWMSSVLNDQVTICSFSQFNQYWILQALGNAGYMEHALASIRLCWSTPLALDKGCFWEQSSPDWKTFMKDGDVAPTMPSYCHPWSSGVTPFLSHVVGGIRPLQPGYKRYIAAPYLSKTYPSVAATINTPIGPITVNATLRNMDADHTWIYNAVVESPSRGYFGILKSIVSSDNTPLAQVNGVILNGKNVTLLTAESIVKDETASSLRQNNHHGNIYGIGISELSDKFRYVKIDKAVRVSLEARYLPANTASRQQNGPPLSTYAPFPDPSYPATIVRVDRSIGGDGLFQYGKDGYLLIGCRNNATDHQSDVSKLPDYIRNVTVLQHGYYGWMEPPRETVEASSSESRKTYFPECIPGKRSLGRVGVDGVGGEMPDWNSILVHVEVDGEDKSINEPFQVSLYFVAKTKSDKFAIQVMDLESLNNIAPTKAIDDYQEGVWWTIQYNQSMRLRLMNMQGLHLSGIGFSRPSYEERDGEIDWKQSIVV